MESTVFNIVNVIQQFHSDLADYYFAQKENNHDTRVIALLDYLARSERYLENYVDTHRLELSKTILESKINIPSEKKGLSLINLNKRDIPDTLDKYEEAMAFAIRMDAMLINFCRHIKEKATNTALANAFKNLCRVTRREKRNLYSYNNLFAD